MNTIIKSGSTLLILIAVIGLAGNTAAGFVEEARTTLDAQWADLGDLQARWADLGVPAEVTAPVAAIPDVAHETLDLPEMMTETATDILTTGAVDGANWVSETLTTTASITVTDGLIVVSSKVVALGGLEKDDSPPVFLIENANTWKTGDSFYVRARFVDLEGKETASGMHLLDEAGERTWRLDLAEIDALPDGWMGTGLLTVHDGLQDGVYDLSDEHEITVRRETGESS